MSDDANRWRGGLALVQLARGQALLHQRDYVIPDDIKQVTVPALAHRVTLRPELWVRQVSADDVVARLLATVPTPRTDPAGASGASGASGAPGLRDGAPAVTGRGRPVSRTYRAVWTGRPFRPAGWPARQRGPLRLTRSPRRVPRPRYAGDPPGMPAAWSRWPPLGCCSPPSPGALSWPAWRRRGCCCSARAPPGRGAALLARNR